MAVVERYVNKNSTAGGDGTTNATTGPNRAYATLNEWESNEQTNLISDTDTHIVYVTGTFTGTSFTMDGWTQDATYFVTIKPAPGEEHDGTPGTGPKLTQGASFTNTVDLRDRYTVLEGIEVECTSSSGSDPLRLGDEYLTVDKCIVAAKTSNNRQGIQVAFRNQTIKNTLIYDCTFRAISTAGATFINGNILYNCTVVNAGGHALYTDSFANFDVRNSVEIDCTSGWTNDLTRINAASTNNAGADSNTANIPGSNSVTSITSADFADYANDNFGPASGGKLVDAGVTIPGFSDDAIGTSRPQGSAWDIGWIEFVDVLVDPNDLASSTTIQTPTALDVEAITVNNLAVSTMIQEPTVLGVGVVEVNDLGSATNIEAPTVTDFVGSFSSTRSKIFSRDARETFFDYENRSTVFSCERRYTIFKKDA